MRSSFLDIINPILWDYFQNHYASELTDNDVSEDKLTELLKRCEEFEREKTDSFERIFNLPENNPINYLLFYDSEKLFDMGGLARKIAIILRRGLHIKPQILENIDNLNILDQYAYMIKLYLDCNTSLTQIKEVCAQIPNGLLVDMILISRIVYANQDYELGKTLIMRRLPEVDCYNIDLLCFYIYLYKAISNTNPTNPLEEYRKLYERLQPLSRANNLYIRFLLGEATVDNYRTIVRLMLKTPLPYSQSIIQFINFSKQIDVDLLEMRDDYKNLLEYFKSLPLFQEVENFPILTQKELQQLLSSQQVNHLEPWKQKQILEQFNRKLCVIKLEEKLKHINNKIKKEKVRTLNELARADIYSLDDYKENQYLSNSVRSLVKKILNENIVSDLFLTFTQAFEISEPLAVKLTENYFSRRQEEQLDYDSLIMIFTYTKEHSKNRHCLTEITDNLLYNAKGAHFIIKLYEIERDPKYLIERLDAEALSIYDCSIGLVGEMLDTFPTDGGKIKFLVKHYYNAPSSLYTVAKRLNCLKALLKRHLDLLISQDLDQVCFNEILKSSVLSDKEEIKFLTDKPEITLNKITQYITQSIATDLESSIRVHSILKRNLKIEHYAVYIGYMKLFCDEHYYGSITAWGLIQRVIRRSSEHTNRVEFFDALMGEFYFIKLVSGGAFLIHEAKDFTRLSVMKSFLTGNENYINSELRATLYSIQQFIRSYYSQSLNRFGISNHIEENIGEIRKKIRENKNKNKLIDYDSSYNDIRKPLMATIELIYLTGKIVDFVDAKVEGFKELFPLIDPILVGFQPFASILCKFTDNSMIKNLILHKLLQVSYIVAHADDCDINYRKKQKLFKTIFSILKPNIDIFKDNLKAEYGINCMLGYQYAFLESEELGRKAHIISLLNIPDLLKDGEHMSITIRSIEYFLDYISSTCKKADFPEEFVDPFFTSIGDNMSDIVKIFISNSRDHILVNKLNVTLRFLKHKFIKDRVPNRRLVEVIRTFLGNPFSLDTRNEHNDVPIKDLGSDLDRDSVISESSSHILSVGISHRGESSSSSTTREEVEDAYDGSSNKENNTYLARGLSALSSVKNSVLSKFSRGI